MIHHPLLSILFLAALPGAAGQPSPAAQERTAVAVRQVGTARLENVPEIPAEVRAAVQRYQNYREARFQDWLADGSMLITTRFGATAQVHHVAAPGRVRTQLTFHDEPVAGAWTVPGAHRFVYSRDTGGDEWFQLYARGVTGGEALALTEPGTRNQAPVFSRDGSRLFWARAMRGSGDYAIMAADPSDPATRRLAWQGTGSVAPADIAEQSGLVLVSRNLSNRENRLLILDPASGETSELTWSHEPRVSPGAVGLSSPSPTPAATCAAWSRSTWRAAGAPSCRRKCDGRWRITTFRTTAGCWLIRSTRRAIRGLSFRISSPAVRCRSRKRSSGAC
jgi:hypothetical protein